MWSNNDYWFSFGLHRSLGLKGSGLKNGGEGRERGSLGRGPWAIKCEKKLVILQTKSEKNTNKIILLIQSSGALLTLFLARLLYEKHSDSIMSRHPQTGASSLLEIR